MEDVPEAEKDWHPGTSKQVLDLVHPSLYCIRIGETLVRKAPADPSQSDTAPGVARSADCLAAPREASSPRLARRT